MSFYGSVYYQLIDTYYKIIVKNSGNETFTFNKAVFNPSGTPDEDLIESPAVGRKGIFTLDSGNYWINFSELKDTEASAPYAIWHSEPHKSENGVPIGFYPEDKYEEREDKNTGKKEIYNKETGEKLIEGTDYIQLYENNFFRVYNQKHDEAGHTYDNDNLSSLYRLPKSETSDDIDELQTYVGVITDENKDDPFMVDRAPKKWVDNDPTKNIPLKSLF
jgi:hypothetical protein